MALLMSVSQTWPARPTRLAKAQRQIGGAAGDVEHARRPRAPRLT
jgi:hypothetical protein